MRFGFVPLDLLRSCASFIAFSFRRPVSRGTQTFQSVRPAEVYCAETAPKQQREELPLGAQAIGLCSASRCRSRRVEEQKLSITAAPIRTNSASHTYV